jgi:hypothetical protein
MHRRTPLGLDDELRPAEGIAAYAGSRIPGPMSTVTDQESNESVVHSHAVPSERPLDTSVSSPFGVGEAFYRLRRIDTGWRSGSNEAAVAPEEAVAILERAIQQHGHNVRLLRLLETAAAQLAGLHEGGIFVLLWLRPESRFEKVAAPAPRAPAPRPPAFPEPRPVAEPMMPPAQATALRNAAAAGVPFCEECARAAAERGAAAAS